jgi:hypothetical protein
LARGPDPMAASGDTSRTGGLQLTLQANHPMRAAHSTRSKQVRQASPLRVPTGLFVVCDLATSADPCRKTNARMNER